MTRLDEIRARLEAATPGPWEAYHARFPNAYGEGFWRVDGPHERGYEGGFERADADLIAHAPEDLRLLLAVAEAAKDVCRPPNACACVGPPGACACLLRGQADLERLRAALDALEAAGEGVEPSRG